MIEYANHREHPRVSSTYEVRGAGRFAANEVRDLMRKRPGLELMLDFRQLGAPEHIFAAILEKRAAKINFKRDSAQITDADRRAESARVAALIQADRDAEFDRNFRLD